MVCHGGKEQYRYTAGPSDKMQSKYPVPGTRVPGTRCDECHTTGAR